MGDPFAGARVVTSPLVPAGTAYLVPDAVETTSLSAFQPDPWGPSPRLLPWPVALERRRALDHLAGLLDGLCESVGLDPDVAWRAPRLAAAQRLSWRGEERISLSIPRPAAAFTITDV